MTRNFFEEQQAKADAMPKGKWPAWGEYELRWTTDAGVYREKRFQHLATAEKAFDDMVNAEHPPHDVELVDMLATTLVAETVNGPITAPTRDAKSIRTIHRCIARTRSRQAPN